MSLTNGKSGERLQSGCTCIQPCACVCVVGVELCVCLGFFWRVHVCE